MRVRRRVFCNVWHTSVVGDMLVSRREYGSLSVKQGGTANIVIFVLVVVIQQGRFLFLVFAQLPPIYCLTLGSPYK